MAKENKYGGAGTSIYFSDAMLLVRVQKLAESCQKSTSALIEELLVCLIDPLEAKMPSQREFELKAKVKL